MAELLVRYHQGSLGVEHAKSARHVVERGVEALGEERHVTLGDHCIEQSAPQSIRDEFKRGEKGQKQYQAEHGVIEIADQEHCRNSWNSGTKYLRDDESTAAEVPTRRANHVGDRHAETDQLDKCIVGTNEGDEAPDAEKGVEN